MKVCSFSWIAVFFASGLLCACSGSSSDEGKLIEGTLTEAGGAAHSKHSAGQRIGGVTVCALGECSLTDEKGQWGFLADKHFNGGDVLFSLNGHGIDETSVVNLPSNATEYVIEFAHVAGGHIEAIEVHVEPASDHDHSSHDHESAVTHE